MTKRIIKTKKKVPSTIATPVWKALPSPSHMPVVGFTGQTVGIQASGTEVLGCDFFHYKLVEARASKLRVTPTKAPTNWKMMIFIKNPVFSLLPSLRYTPSDTAGFMCPPETGPRI